MNYIFDFDGTLMDTSGVILSTIKATIKDMGLPDKTDEECLAIIGINGCRLAIASSRRLVSLTDYLKKLGIEDWFEIVVGADSVTKGKPDPEPVLTVLKAFGWNADDTLVVGDADVDIMMGNAAGCKTCAVTYGNGSIASLKAAQPDYLIDDFKELPV